MTDAPSFRIYEKPQLPSLSLVVGWADDAGKLGTSVVDYLRRKLGGRSLGEIEVTDFFSLGGVSIMDDVARFPESKFYTCLEKGLLLFQSHPPEFEWYHFLSSVLDAAGYYCHIKELYIIGGMVTAKAHTSPRELMAVVNLPEMKKILSEYALENNLDYETPPGQRPTLNSFLLWVAKKRNISGANLWVPVPFYLVSREDPRAWQRAVEFLDKRLGLGLTTTELNEAMVRQDERIAEARKLLPHLDDYITRLENNLSLTVEENERLARDMDEFLRRQS